MKSCFIQAHSSFFAIGKTTFTLFLILFASPHRCYAKPHVANNGSVANTKFNSSAADAHPNLINAYPNFNVRRLGPVSRARRKQANPSSSSIISSDLDDDLSDDGQQDVEHIPRSAMGFLCQDNPLVEELGTRCRTISKSIGSLGCDRKIVELAAERGRNIDAIPLAFRQARVADACPASCGLCESELI